jgi:NAD(P)-dependent dehydrogenase (short-subunit alcohol dehydrogenase family)
LPGDGVLADTPALRHLETSGKDETMPSDVRGLRVLITAGGAGAGRGIARAFLAGGARVHVCDVDAAALDRLRAETPEIGGTLCDVARPEQVDRLFDEAIPRLGGLDALINNAGIAGPTAATEDVTTEEWDRCLAVNASGPFFCARRAIPLLKANDNGRGAGAIVNIVSTSARTGLPLRTPYVVSKVALQGLTKNLARELGPHHIRVNSILPGAIDGERLQRVVNAKAESLGVAPEDYLAGLTRHISMGTLVQPEDLAHMAMFLCSSDGRFVSGQEIGVCGNAIYEE